MMNGWSAILMAVWVSAASARAEPPAPEPERAPPVLPYTSSRLDHEAMRRLLESLMPAIESGDIDEAERRFARLLTSQTDRHGRVSVAGADLQAAFGVTVFNTAREPERRRRGIAYLRRAAEAYAAHFGRDHPEVALTLSDVGVAHVTLAPDDPPPAADEAIEEAYRIRRSTLGPQNVETASSLARLAQLRGLPARTRGDAASIEASAALFRQAIEDFGHQLVVPSGHGAVTTLIDLARMYAVNGRPSEAVSAALEAHRLFRESFRGNVALCGRVRAESRRLALELLARSRDREARRVDRAERRSAVHCTVRALAIPDRPR